MPSTALLLAGVAALLLVLLALKLRGPRGRRDLTGPPKRRIRWGEARRLGALLAAGDREAARWRIRELGHDEAEAQRLLGLAERLSPSIPSDPQPGEGRLAYGRGSEQDETPHDQEARGPRNRPALRE